MLGVCACAFSFYFGLIVQSRHDVVSVNKPQLVRGPGLEGTLPTTSPERVVYPYSVIPGGVHSREELAAAIINDPVVAAHYADFKVGRARIIRAEETKFMHVSYRKQDKVYWTANKVKISEGEALITDGEICARTRCGNQVLAEAEGPFTEEEPMIATFDIPYFVLGETGRVLPSDVYVPEPGTLGLLATGLVTIAVIRLRRRNSRRRSNRQT